MVYHNRAIYQDQHARIIIVARRINLQLEAGYIYVDCTSCQRSPLQSGGGPYILNNYASSGFSSLCFLCKPRFQESQPDRAADLPYNPQNHSYCQCPQDDQRQFDEDRYH